MTIRIIPPFLDPSGSLGDRKTPRLTGYAFSQSQTGDFSDLIALLDKHLESQPETKDQVIIVLSDGEKPNETKVSKSELLAFLAKFGIESVGFDEAHAPEGTEMVHIIWTGTGEAPTFINPDDGAQDIK